MTAILAIFSFLGGVGGFLRRVAQAIPWQVWLGIALAIALFIAVRTVEHKISAAHDAGYAEGVADTKAAVAAAQAKADEVARANVVKTVAKQDAINKESSDALLDTNDAIDRRAAAIRLRHDAALAHQGGPVDPNATGASAAGSGPPATCDGLSWSVAFGLLTQAQKNLAQLNAILDWEAKQDALDAADLEAGK